MEPETEVKATGKKAKSAGKATKQKSAKSGGTTTKAKAATAAKKTTAKPQQTNTVTMITEEERLQMIEKAAYYLAEKRGFLGGDATEDWTIAEREIDNSLKKQSHEAA